MGKIRKILETELVGGTQSTDVYPVTSTKAVYDTDNKVLDDYIQHLKKTSTFAGIATPTTNPGTPDGPVFYIAGEGTYANFSNIVIEAGQLGILKWNGTWSKEVLEIGAGGGSGSGSGSGVSLGTLLTQLNSDNPFPTDNGQVLTYDGSNFIWKTPTGSGGSGSIQVAQTPEYSGESESWVSATKLRFIGITGTKPTITTNSNKGCVDVGIPTGGGSGSSSRISNIKLFTNNSDYPFETIKLGTADTIGFMQGDNITFQAVVKDFTNVIKISATGGSGGSGGSTSTSVSWGDVTNKPNTFTPSSHTHPTSEITGLSSFKASSATNADKLATSRTIWGQSFNGTGNINGNLKMGTAGGGSIQLLMNNGNMLERTNDILHIGNGLKGLSNGEIDLDAYATKVYTDNMSKHYDFKSNVFDVNSNQIHFGSETNGGKIYWDAANNAFKIEGNVYATGGITALGVSNNATTSNNVDFTFRSVTANTFNVKNSIELSDSLKLNRVGDNITLVNTNSDADPTLYLGNSENYFIDTNGNSYFNNLTCEVLGFAGVSDFSIINADDRSFTLSFKYNGRTYHFTPSEGSISVS